MKKNESGRSMVEMLGVLAIIGVLSVGGIAGYTMAMNKYRVNEAVHTIAMAGVACATGDTSLDDFTNDFVTELNCGETEGARTLTYELGTDVNAANVASALASSNATVDGLTFSAKVVAPGA